MFQSSDFEDVPSHALFTIDGSGSIVGWPPSAERLYGYDPETVLGEHAGVLLADDDEPKVDNVAEVHDERSDGTATAEHRHERSDGSVFWGTLTISPSGNESEDKYLAACQNTTERKEYERALERQNDRLKEFTDILAHDLRNPLTIVDQRLALYSETGDREHLQAIEDTIDRMSRLVDDLLRVARQGGVVKEPTPTDCVNYSRTSFGTVSSTV